MLRKNKDVFLILITNLRKEPGQRFTTGFLKNARKARKPVG